MKLILVILVLYYIFMVCYISRSISNQKFPEYNKYKERKSSKIPNVIYTYWHDGDFPPLVSKCIESWKRHNPGYTIVVLSKENLQQYIPFDINQLRFANTQQQKSDFIRIYVLAEYGGIWLDASIYLNQSLDWIHAYQFNENSEFVGYKINAFTKTFPVIENWFLACVPKSNFMNDWKDVFYSMNNYETIESYVNSIKQTTDFQGIPSYYFSYLTMHIACQYILQHNNYKLSILEAEKGPFLYLEKIYWNHLYFIPIISIHKGKESPVVKYRKGERIILEKLYLTNFLD